MAEQTTPNFSTEVARRAEDERKVLATLMENQKISPNQLTASDWQRVYYSVYGNNMPDFPALRRVFNAVGPTASINNTSVSPAGSLGSPSGGSAGVVPGGTSGTDGVGGATGSTTAVPGGNNQQPTDLNYRGFDIGDKAIQGAYGNYQSMTNPNDFLNMVRSKLKEKFKPESETLGVGDFAKNVGWSGPQGWNAGMQEKNLAIRQKGALALDALGKANDVFAEHAKVAKDKFDTLWSMRDAYEKTQKETENALEDLALKIAEQGGDIPGDLLELLPADRRGWYTAMSAAEKAKEAREAASRASSSSGIVGTLSRTAILDSKTGLQVGWSVFNNKTGVTQNLDMNDKPLTWADSYKVGTVSEGLKDTSLISDIEKMKAAGLSSEKITEWIKSKNQEPFDYMMYYDLTP